MSHSPTPAKTGERVRISCPGCGRHDYVIWPEQQESLAFKCFNCEKTTTLHKGGKH